MVEFEAGYPSAKQVKRATTDRKFDDRSKASKSWLNTMLRVQRCDVPLNFHRIACMDLTDLLDRILKSCGHDRGALAPDSQWQIYNYDGQDHAEHYEKVTMRIRRRRNPVNQSFK